MNRATAGLYPPGSTWKPVTALAAMQDHVVGAYESLLCAPVAYYGLDRQKFVNWNPYTNRWMTLAEALAESCDTYFYQLGDRFYRRGQEGRVRMQQWARTFGFGAPTGLDIGGEADGLLPTPDWRWKTFESDWDRAWNPGDSIQLSIGQKDLLVTPLQMTAFYSMLANGGDNVTPHLVSDVEQRERRARHASSSGASRRGSRSPRASTRPRSTLCATVCTARRTRPPGPPPPCSPTTESRSPARRVLPRRSSSCRAIRPTTSRISPGGAAGGRPTRPRSSSAR